jgi:hypothetical protein
LGLGEFDPFQRREIAAAPCCWSMRRRRLSLPLLLLLLRFGQCDGLLSLDHNVVSKLPFPL